MFHISPQLELTGINSLERKFKTREPSFITLQIYSCNILIRNSMLINKLVSNYLYFLLFASQNKNDYQFIKQGKYQHSFRVFVDDSRVLEFQVIVTVATSLQPGSSSHSNQVLPSFVASYSEIFVYFTDMIDI